MSLTIIEWDGQNLPPELQRLPPGRHVVESVDDVEPLTSSEEDGIIAALDDLEAENGIPLDDALRSIRDLCYIERMSETR